MFKLTQGHLFLIEAKGQNEDSNILTSHIPGYHFSISNEVCNNTHLTNSSAFPSFSAEAVHFCLSNDQCGYFASYRRFAMETCLYIMNQQLVVSLRFSATVRQCSIYCSIAIGLGEIVCSGFYLLKHESSFLLFGA